MLQEINFRKSFAINYDPHHVISQRGQLNKNKAFEHQEVEGLAERVIWMDYPTQMKDTEVSQENPLAIIKSIVVTPNPSKVEVIGKRTHSEAMDT